MIVERQNLNFHQAFKPERNYISSILTDGEKTGLIMPIAIRA